MAELRDSTAELIANRNWDGLAHRLCSLAYVQRKAEAGRILDVVGEFDAAVAAIPSNHPMSSILPVLATALRRSAALISRHPETTFQCFWNLCWWHDCADRGDFAEAWSDSPKPCVGRGDRDGSISQLMESWRSERAPDAKGSVWVRSLLPPATSVEGRLWLEIPIDFDTGRPVALRLSGDYLVGWFRHKTDAPESRVWSRHTGEPIPEFDSKQCRFQDPRRSLDSRLEVSFGGEDGGWGHPVRVSEARTGISIAAFPIDDDHNVHSAVFSADGRSLAAGAYGVDYEGYVYVWDLQSKSLRTRFQSQSGVYCLDFSQTGDEVLAGCSNGVVEIWKLATGALVNSIRAHDAGVICAAFSSDGKWFASISYDGTLRLWNLFADQGEEFFIPHPDDVAEAKFSPNGDRLVTRSANGTTWLWNGHTGRPIKCLHKSPYIVLEGGDPRVSLFVGNYMIASVARGGGVWKSSDGYRLADVAESVHCGQSICFTSDGKRFAVWDESFGETGVLAIRDIKVGNLWDTASEAEESKEPNGRFIAVMTADGTIRTRRLPDPIELARIQAHTGGITSCAFSTDNTLLVSGGADDTVKVWDWKTGRQVFSATLMATPPPQHTRETRSSTPSRPRIQEVKFLDEHKIAAWVDGAQILTWNFRSGEYVETVSWTGTLDEYPHKRRYYAEDRSGEVCILDTDTGKELAWFECGRDLVSSLRLIAHPSGRAWVGLLGHRIFHFALDSQLPLSGAEGKD